MALRTERQKQMAPVVWRTALAGMRPHAPLLHLLLLLTSHTPAFCGCSDAPKAGLLSLTLPLHSFSAQLLSTSTHHIQGALQIPLDQGQQALSLVRPPAVTHRWARSLANTPPGKGVTVTLGALCPPGPALAFPEQGTLVPSGKAPRPPAASTEALRSETQTAGRTRKSSVATTPSGLSLVPGS